MPTMIKKMIEMGSKLISAFRSKISVYGSKNTAATASCETVQSTAGEEYGSFAEANSELDADFCLRANGDSMTGARIYDGDLVFIRAQDSVDNGDIAAVIINDEATLKRVYYYPNESKLVLSPENPKYPPFVYIKEELNSIKIIGKAVAFQSVII